MRKTSMWIAAALIASVFPPMATGQEPVDVSAKYKALMGANPTLGTTWAIIEHDGARRPVEPYLSSLGQGESGTGMVTSPPFQLAVDTITFTIRGHDGQQGGRDENYIALVDARKGNTLMKTAAPGHDALQEQSWDVGQLKGKEVRIEVHDGNSATAYAWLGIGRIDAGAINVDFRQGMPDGWDRPARKATVRHELLSGGVPFRRNASVFTMIPDSGSVEIPCGFSAKRLFFLGCTVSGGKALTTYGGIELHYATGSPEVIPLMCGFTLDGQHKTLSRGQAMHLHASTDPYQPYLVVKPRADVIEKIRLVAQPDRVPIPRITAITCETAAESDRLMPLPDSEPSAEEAAWIASHGVSADSPERGPIIESIRAANNLPAATTNVRFRKHRLDDAFRSEGVAVADFNGDGRLDIAAGNVYYAGPDWKMVPMLGRPQQFNRRGYADAFLCFDDDVNRDGATDLIVVGFPGRQTHWLENPGKVGAVWIKHLAVERTGNESPAYADIDGDGRRELLFIDGKTCATARPGQDPTQPWTVRPVAGPGDPGPGHGLGFGDVDGDGRADVLIPNGWWQGPASPNQTPWRFHPAEFFGGAQLGVADLDGDGDADVLGSSAHGYGIAWTEQTPDGWQVHEIDDADSQTHALHLADINGDGLVDFVTGKRYWAHNGRDPGSFQPAVLCWYEMKRGSDGPTWTKHVVDYQSGVGLHFRVVDVTGDGRLDLVTSNKLGVHIFEQVAR